MRFPLAALLSCVAIHADAAPLETVEQIEDCIEQNLPERASKQTVLMRSVDRAGAETETRAIIFWKEIEPDRSRLLLRVTDPATRRDSALLAIQTDTDQADMYMYLPELEKVRRVSKHSVGGSLFGTDLTYEDFERIQNLTKDSESKRLPDEVLDGRAVYVIESRPSRGDDSEYERVVTAIDQEWCVALRASSYDRAGELRKISSTPVDRVTREKSGWVPRIVRVEDRVDESYTELIIEKIEPDVEIKDQIFSLRKLELGR